MLMASDMRKIAKNALSIFTPDCGIINVEEFIFARLDLASMSAEISEEEVKTILEAPGKLIAEIESYKRTPTKIPNPIAKDWKERLFYYQLFGWEVRKSGQVYTFTLLDEDGRKVGGPRSDRPHITLEEWLKAKQMEVNQRYCRGDVY